VNGKKKEPWRIVVGLISIAYIIFMWVKKDIVDIYATMPKEEVLLLVVTTVAVSVLKVAIIAVVILLMKWIIRKIKGKRYG
jgi:hypothetical protein